MSQFLKLKGFKILSKDYDHCKITK